MVERWMKERAMKSFGGPCMSKFVQENERKRLIRLRNMKSSISKSSSNKHDSWTKDHFDKRHREIQRSKRATVGRDGYESESGRITTKNDHTTKNENSNHPPDFDLRFRPEVDVTKSGLKLKLNSKPSNSKPAASCAQEQYIKIADKKNNPKKLNDTKLMNHTGRQTCHREIVGEASSVATTMTDDDALDPRLPTLQKASTCRSHEEKENKSPKQILVEETKEEVNRKSSSSLGTKRFNISSSTSSSSISKTKSRSSANLTSKGEVVLSKKSSNNDSMMRSTNEKSNTSNKQYHDQSKMTLALKRQGKKNATLKVENELGMKNKTFKSSKFPNFKKKEKISSSEIAHGNSMNINKKNNSMKKLSVSNSMQKQLHANRGVSLESLSKEKEEALALLKEIDNRASLVNGKCENGDGSDTQESLIERFTISTSITKDHTRNEEEEALSKVEYPKAYGGKIFLINDNVEDLSNQKPPLEDIDDSKSLSSTKLGNEHSDFSMKVSGVDEVIVKLSEDLLHDNIQRSAEASPSDTKSRKDGWEYNEIIDQQLSSSESHGSMPMSSRSSVASYSDTFDSECALSPKSNTESSSIKEDLSKTEIKSEHAVDTSCHVQSPTKAELNDSVDWTPQFNVKSFFFQS